MADAIAVRERQLEKKDLLVEGNSAPLRVDKKVGVEEDEEEKVRNGSSLLRIVRGLTHLPHSAASTSIHLLF